MVTRRFLGAAVMAAALVGASGVAHAAAERSLVGIVLGRSYRQVLAKFGTPNQVQVVVIPVPGQGTAGIPDQNNPGGAPGYGGPGGPPGYGGPGGPPGYGGPPGGSGGGAGYGGPPGYGGPGGSGGGMSGGPPGGSGGPSYGSPVGSGGPPGYGGPGGSGGGPPALPPVGGAPGMPGYGEGPGGPGSAPVTGVGNGAEWIYNRPGGVTMAFIINEDGRVAQISVSSPKAYPPAHTAKGIGLGADYKRVLMAYGFPPQELIGGYYVEAYYTKNYHASFTFVKGKLVRLTIALAD